MRRSSRRCGQRLAALPGVDSVGATSNIPFGGNWSTGSFNVEGYQPPEGQPGPWGDQRLVTPGYHETMKIKLLQGAPASRPPTAPARRKSWSSTTRWRSATGPNADPIGKRITFADDMSAADVDWITVVGVVEHTAHEGLDAERRVQLYRPVQQQPIMQMTYALRSQGDPAQLVTAVRQAVLDIDPDQPIAQVRTMEAMMDEALGQRKLSMYLLGTFAGLALLLSAIGIYGVMSFDVTRRSQELGVRMALGAARSSVLTLVMRQGVGLALVGVAIGLAGAFALTRVLEAQLFGITRTDPATFALVAVVLTLVATMATLVPALRATRLDPVRALRCE